MCVCVSMCYVIGLMTSAQSTESRLTFHVQSKDTTEKWSRRVLSFQWRFISPTKNGNLDARLWDWRHKHTNRYGWIYIHMYVNIYMVKPFVYCFSSYCYLSFSLRLLLSLCLLMFVCTSVIAIVKRKREWWWWRNARNQVGKRRPRRDGDCEMKIN